MEQTELECIIIDVDYVHIDDRSVIRLTLKSKGKVFGALDTNFHPYFYLKPHNASFDVNSIKKIEILHDGETIRVHDAEIVEKSISGTKLQLAKIYSLNTRSIPKLSESMLEFGEVYEYDILFWKRYLIDHNISPLT